MHEQRRVDVSGVIFSRVTPVSGENYLGLCGSIEKGGQSLCKTCRRRVRAHVR